MSLKAKNSSNFVAILAKQCRPHFNLTNIFGNSQFRADLRFSLKLVGTPCTYGGKSPLQEWRGSPQVKSNYSNINFYVLMSLFFPVNFLVFFFFFFTLLSENWQHLYSNQTAPH